MPQRPSPISNANSNEKGPKPLVPMTIRITRMSIQRVPWHLASAPGALVLNKRFLLQTGLGLPIGSVSPSQLLFLLPTAVVNGPLTVQRAGDVLTRVGD